MSHAIIQNSMKTPIVIRKGLLLCGIFSSLLYIFTDILGGLSWAGYSFISQYVSELTAIGAPSRSLVLPFFFAYNLLLIAFAFGVWEVAGRRRPLRLITGLLAGVAVIGLVTYFFPMHLRGDEATLSDAMHAALAAVTVIFILLAMTYGLVAYRNWFRFYSAATILITLALAILAFLAAPQLAARQATPGVGLGERISIYSYLLWVLVLAIVLLQAENGPRIIGLNSTQPGATLERLQKDRLASGSS
jgi:uncharacterized protein DUF998